MTEIAQRQDMECAVCLLKWDHPTKLPCGHIFCFLCVKGVAIQNRKCALCRAPIPINYFDNPILLEDLSSRQESEEEAEKFQWYYEGRNGWWKYDERSNSQLEVAHENGEQFCSLLVAGSLYTIDFPTMLQTRRNDPRRRRRVRRDVPSMPAKGIAGIKVINSEEAKEPSEDVAETNNEEMNTGEDMHYDENEIGENNHNDERNNQGDIVNNQNDEGDNEGDIVNIENDERNNEGDIVNIQNYERNNEGDIVNIQNDERNNESYIVNIQNDESNNEGDNVIDRLESLRLNHPEIEEPSHSLEQEES